VAENKLHDDAACHTFLHMQKLERLRLGGVDVSRFYILTSINFITLDILDFFFQISDECHAKLRAYHGKFEIKVKKVVAYY